MGRPHLLPQLIALAIPITLLAADASAPAAEQSSAGIGVVAAVEGHARTRPGHIRYNRVQPGETLKFSLRTKRYKATVPDSPGAVVADKKSGEPKRLEAGSTLQVGEVLETAKGASAKILFKDDVILDLSEQTVLEIASYSAQSASFRLLSGRFRLLIEPKNKSAPAPSKEYAIETPGPLAWVTGTEFTVGVRPDPVTQKLRTDLILTKAKASADLTKHTASGLVYRQPIKIQQGAVLYSTGLHGLVHAQLVRERAPVKTTPLLPNPAILLTARPDFEIEQLLPPGSVDLKTYAPAPGRAIASASRPNITEGFRAPQTFADSPAPFNDAIWLDKPAATLPALRLPGF